MIYRVQEGNIVIYTGLEGYNNINKVFEELYLYFVLTTINWNQNKKYFNDKKEKDN